MNICCLAEYILYLANSYRALGLQSDEESGATLKLLAHAKSFGSIPRYLVGI